MKRCRKLTEVYSRVCGYFSPVQSWNPGKRAEFGDRLDYPMRYAAFTSPSRGEARPSGRSGRASNYPRPQEIQEAAIRWAASRGVPVFIFSRMKVNRVRRRNLFRRFGLACSLGSFGEPLPLFGNGASVFRDEDGHPMCVVYTRPRSAFRTS